MADSKLSVLIVCLGNICRSPMGEAVLRHIATERGVDITVDSCGTAGHHVGEEPNDRTIKTCMRHDVPIEHCARQISPADFIKFNYILACDGSNLRNLERVRPEDATAVLRLWGSYGDDKSVPDPYYGGIKGFEQVYEQCVKLSHAFLDHVVGTST